MPLSPWGPGHFTTLTAPTYVLRHGALQATTLHPRSRPLLRAPEGAPLRLLASPLLKDAQHNYPLRSPVALRGPAQLVIGLKVYLGVTPGR